MVYTAGGGQGTSDAVIYLETEMDGGETWRKLRKDMFLMMGELYSEDTPCS